MPVIESVIKKVQGKGRKLVLAEGNDPRVVTAATEMTKLGIAEVTVLGTEAELAASCASAGLKDRNFKCLDHAKSPKFQQFSNELYELRKKKGVTPEKAAEMMSNRLFYGAMMVRLAEVDGMVAGSIASTADMLRAAFNVVGTAPGIKTASSVFIMDLKTPAPNGENVLFYADCAVNPNPDAEQLSDIAIATATTYRAVMGQQPKLAFLSFSTKGSAQHELVDKVVKATEITRRRIEEQKLDIIIDGELQADSALVLSVGQKKCPGSPVAGKANILIFPDLNAGNICYKITERLAGAGAFGPVLQGLGKPINDLSRGCSANDIVGTGALTICQAMG